MSDLLEDMGVTPEAVVYRDLLPLMNATKIEFLKNDTEFVELADNATRLKALHVYFLLTGAYAPKQQTTQQATRMEARKRQFETELTNLTKALAGGQLSHTIMAAIAVREREIAEITSRVISSNVDSIRTRVANMTATAKSQLKNLRSLLDGDVTVARAALLKRVDRIEMETEGKIYVAKGNWKLLGEVRPREGWCRGPGLHRSRHRILPSSFIPSRTCHYACLTAEALLRSFGSGRGPSIQDPFIRAWQGPQPGNLRKAYDLSCFLRRQPSAFRARTPTSVVGRPEYPHML